jgi:GMP synthase-like glutamine amidotransferase
MILLVDNSYRKNSLGYDEFVMPVVRILHSAGAVTNVVHYRDVGNADIAQADAAILCGTALMDNEFLTDPAIFSWIADAGIPVLGVCGGMQAISCAFGGAVRLCCEIGMTDIRTLRDDPLFAGKTSFKAYALHSRVPEPPPEFEVVAVSATCVQAIRHRSKPVWGVLFHPEVRNEWVVTRFSAQVRESQTSPPDIH